MDAQKLQADAAMARPFQRDLVTEEGHATLQLKHCLQQASPVMRLGQHCPVVVCCVVVEVLAAMLLVRCCECDL